MAEPKNRRLVTEKRGFRVKPIKHPRYSYVVYRIADGRRVEQAYFQSERAANSHAYTENIRLKNEGLEGQILGSGANLKGSASGGNGLADRTGLRTGTLQGSAFRPRDNCPVRAVVPDIQAQLP